MGRLREDDVYPKINAIGWGSIDSIKIPFNSLYSKGPMEGEGVSDGTLLSIWSDHQHITNLMEGLCQDDNTFRIDSIVIGDQNIYFFGHYDSEKT